MQDPLPTTAGLVSLKPPKMKYMIGSWVRTSLAFSSPPRRLKVAAYRLSSTGQWFYELADGGWFSENELEASR